MASYFDAIDQLDDAEQLALYRAVCKYGIDGVEPELTGVPKIVFGLIKPTIDSSINRYNTCVENGKKGGRPPKQKPEDNQTETREETKAETRDETKMVKPNCNLNKDMDKDKDKDKEIIDQSSTGDTNTVHQISFFNPSANNDFQSQVHSWMRESRRY